MFNLKIKNSTKTNDSERKVVNVGGGVGYEPKSLIKLDSLLTTLKLNANRYYSTVANDIASIAEAVQNCVKHNGAMTTAKAIVRVRSRDGHRSSTHVAAVELMPYLSGEQFAKAFFCKRERQKNANNGGVVFRLDDMSEILSYYMIKKVREKGLSVNDPKSFDGINMPNSMKKGFRKALEDCDWYLLGKYQMKSRMVKLVDLINLTHPRPEYSVGVRWMKLSDYRREMNGVKDLERRIEQKKQTKHFKHGVMYRIPTGSTEPEVLACGFEAVVNGWMREENTSSSKNTKSGQELAQQVKAGTITKEQKEEIMKHERTNNFRELIENGRIGYLELWRNLGNIIKTGDKPLIEKACAMLVDPKKVNNPNSLIWPGQIQEAHVFVLENLEQDNITRYVLKHIEEAYDMSCKNLEDLGVWGRSEVVIDSSGSMHPYGGRQYNFEESNVRNSPLGIGSLLGATIARGCSAGVWEFADRCDTVKVNHSDSVFSICKKIFKEGMRSRFGYGTNMASIFQTLPKANRIFIVSDMQLNRGGSLVHHVNEYIKRTGAHGVFIYLINADSYGTFALPSHVSEANIVQTSGYSFDMLKKLISLETNPDVLYEEINAINMEPSTPWNL